MMPWKQWFDSEEIKKYREMGDGRYISTYFARNPFRPVYYNPRVFYSPADGVITFAKVVDPDEEIIRVKGRQLTVRDLLCDKNYNKKSIVVHIFMTFYDVHINRMPLDGYLEVKPLPPLEPQNLPMVYFEQELFEKGAINHDLCGFFFANQRDLLRIYNPRWNLTYYVVQIADLEVNVIAQFYRERSYVTQGDRITLIAFGSSVVLIIPVDNHVFKLLADQYIGYHVEAGLDPLVEILD